MKTFIDEPSTRPIRAATSRPPVLGPTRNPVSVSGGTFRAKHKSAKGANLIKSESLLELRAAGLLEFARCVTHISYQPLKLRIRISGRTLSYKPDFQGHRVTGGNLLVEVKPWELAQHPEMQRKFRAAADAARDIGARFIVLTERQIFRAGTVDMRRLLDLRRDWIVENLGGPPLAESLEEAAAMKWADSDPLRRSFADGRRHSVAATLRLLGGDDAPAALNLLLAARVLAWPIKQRLVPTTPLNAFAADDDEQLFD